ncbi:MAG: sigma-54 dependent transcriptional regulator [Myxococcota bacterium]
MKILIVDDEQSVRELLEILFRGWGYEFASASNLQQARAALDAGDIDLVVTDMRLGSDSGMDVLRAARATAFPPEVIMLTAFGTPATAIEAIREGAYDYITKPFDNDELRLLTARALEKREMRGEVLRLRRGLTDSRVVLGESPAMTRVWSLVDRVAASPRSIVLVTGESGTGKEVVARAIHDRSERARNPFLAINCAAIPEGVLESELFGHRRGAFTGADRDRDGLLLAAGQGTLFLDEIGEVSAAIQAKLLRVLQERTVRPVGGSREVSVEARIIAATNKDLEQEVRAGRFREDLLYRLNVITIELPPLRERQEDIPALANAFLSRVAAELQRPGLHFAPETMEMLRRYAFPGNVRQLQNLVERAATLSETDELGLDSLPPALRGVQESDGSPLQLAEGFSLERHLDELERRYLLQALKASGGAKTRAAELLGLSFRSFRYRLAKHGLTDADEPKRS